MRLAFTRTEICFPMLSKGDYYFGYTRYYDHHGIVHTFGFWFWHLYVYVEKK